MCIQGQSLLVWFFSFTEILIVTSFTGLLKLEMKKTREKNKKQKQSWFKRKIYSVFLPDPDTNIPFTGACQVSYHRRLRSLLLCCDVFQALINSLACCKSTQHTRSDKQPTWIEDFTEFDHLHQSQAYDSSFGVVSTAKTISKASPNCYNVLDRCTTH